MDLFSEQRSIEQQLLTMNTRGDAVESLWPIYIPEQYLGATRLRMYSKSHQTTSQRSLQEKVNNYVMTGSGGRGERQWCEAS